MRRRAFKRDGYRCRDCGKAGRLEAHHTVPVADDPSRAFDLSNIRTLCRTCHVDLHRPPVPPEVEAWKRLVAELLQG